MNLINCRGGGGVINCRGEEEGERCIKLINCREGG